MGRFRREFRFTMKTKRHLFFLVLLWLIVASAVWIFRISLENQLKRAFPGDYSDSPKRTESTFKLVGTTDSMAQVEPIDLKSEMLFNKALRTAKWMNYREVVLESVYIREYQGPNDMLMSSNKSVELDGATYANVKAIWADAKVAAEANLGMYAEELFRHPTDYINNLYVMLGANYRKEEVYKVGDTIRMRVPYGNTEAVVTGFFDEGASVMVDGKSVCLDSYVFCPLMNMDNLYGEAPAKEETYLAPIYLSEAFVPEGSIVSGTPIVKGDKTYEPVSCIWFDRALRDNEELDEWFRKFLEKENTYSMTSLVLGCNYQKKGVTAGKIINYISAVGNLSGTCVAFFPEGMYYTVDGESICLDDYIGIVQFDYTKMYPDPVEGQPSQDAAGATPTPTPEESAPSNTVATMGTEVTYNLAERTKLYKVLFMKNSAYLSTSLTADEAQRELSSIADKAWRNFRLEKEGNNPISTYRIREASNVKGILFRDDVKPIVDKLEKVGKPLFLAGMFIVLLYFIFKRKSTQEYFVMLLLTGTSALEIMMLFVVEMILLFVGSVGFGYLFSYLICRILHITATSWHELIRWNTLAVFVPGLVVLLCIALADYGKMFRRGRR